MLSERRVHTTLPVADLDAARAFYEGVLGFQPLEVRATLVLYRAGEGTLFAVSRGSARSTGGHTQMAFTVPDIEAEVRDLERRGVALEAYDLPGLRTEGGVAPMVFGRGAWFRDPDGNLVALVELATA